MQTGGSEDVSKVTPVNFFPLRRVADPGFFYRRLRIRVSGSDLWFVYLGSESDFLVKARIRIRYKKKKMSDLDQVIEKI